MLAFPFFVWRKWGLRDTVAAVFMALPYLYAGAAIESHNRLLTLAVVAPNLIGVCLMLLHFVNPGIRADAQSVAPETPIPVGVTG